MSQPSQSGNRIPPHLVLLEQITALWLSKAIQVATLLRIPDLLKDGPQNVQALAEASKSDESLLYRLLRALAAYGIFSEDEPRVFAQSELSHLLRENIPGSMRYTALMTAGPWEWKAWGALERSVFGEGPAFDAVYGQPIWQFFAEQPHEEQVFGAAMAELATSVNPLIVRAYDFSRFKAIVDVGGGQGSLLIALLSAYPDLKGILFDRPSVVERARVALAAAGMRERSKVIGGDMLASLPGGADAYLLKAVLHNWTDPDVVAILRNCCQAGGPGTTLLAAEQLILPGSSDPASAFIKLLDLQMMAVSPGRERTEEEFRGLFDAAGFTLLRSLPTPSGYCVLEGRAV